jgi:hypothetical protein
MLDGHSSLRQAREDVKPLNHLNLTGNALRGLPALSRLPHLHELWLSRELVDPGEVESLRQAMPRLRLHAF